LEVGHLTQVRPGVALWTCPRCGRRGSLRLKSVRGGSGKLYRMPYMEHNSREPGVRWCYIPRGLWPALPEAVRRGVGRAGPR
jgi:hypothetical protein